MRTRAKALTIAAAMVLTFAILPTFGAAAAEPLEDGSYDVVIGETTYTVDVTEGSPSIEGTDGVEFTFAFDEETNRVLDEFVVTVDGVSYDVAVAEDGTVTVTEGEQPEGDDESEGDDLDEGDDEGDEGDEEEDDTVETLEQDDTVETLEEDDVEGDEVDDAAHGAVVSTVARCAPNGWQARGAGLPNHGFFVSAAARGEQVEFEAQGEPHAADLSSQEGADAFCDLAEQWLADARAELGAAGAGGEGVTADGDKGRGNSNGKGRANAPGQLKKTG